MPAKPSIKFPEAGNAPQSSWPGPARLKERARRSVAAGLHATGMLGLLRRFEGSHQLSSSPASRWPKLRKFNSSKFGILCYHRVGTEGVPLFSRLHPAVFEAQMKYLRDHYRVVPLGQLCAELKNGDLVKPTLAITFDDGYRDLYTHAFPVLQKFRIPATIYLIGRSMETGECPWYDRIFVALDDASVRVLEVELDMPRQFQLNSVAARRDAAWEIICYLRKIPDGERIKWCGSFEARMRPSQDKLNGRMLDWSQVRLMQAAGVYFGAHTMTHPSVARVEAARLEVELNSSRKLLEAGLDTPAEDFAYPFGKPGDCLSACTDFLSRFGYRSAVTTVEGINSDGADLWRLNRMQIGDDPSLSLFAFNVARMFFEGVSAKPAADPARGPHHASLAADRRVS